MTWNKDDYIKVIKFTLLLPSSSPPYYNKHCTHAHGPILLPERPHWTTLQNQKNMVYDNILFYDQCQYSLFSISTTSAQGN